MQTSDALRAYFSRVVPAVPELFNMAHAICGNYDLAEYALQYTLMEAWIGESHGGMGFREGLRNTLRQVAVEEATELRAEAPEGTWNGLSGQSDDPLLATLAQESVEVRRIAALRYGCELSPARIARVVNEPVARVRETLERLERRAARRLEPNDRRRYDALMTRAVKRAFSQQDDSMPSLSTVYRSFAAEAAETQRPKHLAAKILRRALCVVLLAVCAVTFWFAAALIHPAAPSEGVVQEERAE